MNISRRSFIVGSAVVGGGLWLGLSLRKDVALPSLREGTFAPNAFLQITNTGEVIFQLPKSEMGQGVETSLTTLIGEELDMEPSAITVEYAGGHSDYKVSGDTTQITGGSTSTAVTFTPLREAGAAARAMLVAAAAAQWNVGVDQCTTELGSVINSADGTSLSYAQLADAANEYADTAFKLKPRSEYRWLGKSAPRLDSRAKSTGQARYSMDTQLPGMKTAVVIRPGQLAATLKSFSGEAALAARGVEAVFAIHSGVVVVADNYWHARSAAKLLTIDWEDGPLATLDSATIRKQQEEALETGEGHTVIGRGDVATAQSDGNTVIRGRYAVPYAHHSPMEPQNATALIEGDRCTLWASTQAPDLAQAVAAHYGDIPRDNVIIHSLTLGGGFGRRAYVDFIGEVAAIAKQLEGTPVKLVWSREDDMQHDFYRPTTLHDLSGTLSAQGAIDSWQHRIVSPSIIEGLGVMLASALLPAWIPMTISRSLGRIGTSLAAESDDTTAEGAKVVYAMPHQSVEQILHDPGVPIGFWRSVGFSSNCFAAESFLDEMAHAAQQDPYTFRENHLAESPRYLGVLKLVAEKAGWGSPASGRFQGLAVVEPFRSFCATIVEVSISGNTYKVERVVSAVDCGFVLNPDIVTAQVESAIIYGLTAATKPPITIAGGAVQQSNFHDAQVLRMNETPDIEVHIVSSDESPTGIGEIGLPAVAPALGNAIFAATGKRLRELPLTLS
jgi:isoquinoline 1-oxidoreductase beta subunit